MSRTYYEHVRMEIDVDGGDTPVILTPPLVAPPSSPPPSVAMEVEVRTESDKENEEVPERSGSEESGSESDSDSGGESNFVMPPELGVEEGSRVDGRRNRRRRGGNRKKVRQYRRRRALSTEKEKRRVITKELKAKAVLYRLEYKMKLQDIADELGVAKSSITEWCQGKSRENIGQARLLSPEEEQLLMDYIKLRKQCGLPMTRKEFRLEVGIILKGTTREKRMKNGMPG